MTATTDSPPCLQSEPTISRYFETFNQQQFAATASLFAPEGALLAPFEAPVTGYEAILAYLEQEAAGMEAHPRSLEIMPADGLDSEIPAGSRQIVVKGSVKAVVFNVNVAWIFQLDGGDLIQQVRVKLLASLEDLIQFRPQASPSKL